jgi:predicted AlkP superfamily pyrophosphatase or phosphodiesterase
MLPLLLVLVTAGLRLASGRDALSLGEAPAQEAPAGEQAGTSDRALPQVFDHVVLISVDGLRSDALVALPAEALPGFTRLRRGASTLNARTDPDLTITLPNHTSMITGRPVHGPGGHGWTSNGEPRADESLQGSERGYIAGIFDVAHDRGVRTALFAGKTKFVLYDQSWNAERGAPDTVGEDQGRDKIDRYLCAKSPALTAEVIALLRERPAHSLTFLHYADPDLAAHAAGWDVTPGSTYLRAVQAVDHELDRLLDAILEIEGARGRTAVILTADHGGGAPWKSHDQAQMWIDYVIPFLVWTGEDQGGLELYALNAATRRDPSLSRPTSDAPVQPIRNGEAGNLALALLGLPPVPGSLFGVRQDLRVR